MAHQILSTCTSCGECEPNCPVEAIHEGDTQYYIDEAACVDCNGFAPSPLCVKYCPLPGTIVKIES
ncbi:ferredoxin [candidate division KSB1 bacterium 4484_87]|nr:MAG: ferredoxin [candidate division KSB1 bacterium 4484_87]